MNAALLRAHQMVAETPEPNELAWYMPSQWFFRQAIRDAETIEELREIAMRTVLELEHLREWCEAVAEVIPPKRFVLNSEAAVKRMRLISEDEESELPPYYHPVLRY